MTEIMVTPSSAKRKRARRPKGPLSTGSEWTFDLIDQYYREIERIARDFELDTYPNQL